MAYFVWSITIIIYQDMVDKKYNGKCNKAQKLKYPMSLALD